MRSSRLFVVLPLIICFISPKEKHSGYYNSKLLTSKSLSFMFCKYKISYK